MSTATVEVYLKQTGESFNVPVQLKSTMKDVIKYACQQSVCREKHDYDDYYLVWNNSEMLDDDMTFAESKVFTTDTLRLQLHMKTAIRQQIMNLALQNLRTAKEERVVEQKTSNGDNQSSVITKNNGKVGINNL